jgi:Fic family protein
MRKKSFYIHEIPQWPQFTWDQSAFMPFFTELLYRQGKLLGRMEALGFKLREEANLETIILDVLKSSEIEGEFLDINQVKSSVARKLGMDIGGLVPADRHVEGVVEMTLDATQGSEKKLSNERLFNWHAALFPTGRAGMHTITVGAWRDNKKEDPMQVVSGAMGKEKIHFRAPDAHLLDHEMKNFIAWFNEDQTMNSVLKAAVAHLWFITIHPFEDGNGRIARAITDLQLCRSDASIQRFYSMSAQIRKERSAYYAILEETQKGSLDITNWIVWFLQCLLRAIVESEETLGKVLYKAKFWEKHATTIFNKRQHIMLNKLLDGFTGKLNSSKWAKIAKCSSDTALRDIQDLIDKNVLQKEAGGGRSTSYLLTTHRF